MNLVFGIVLGLILAVAIFRKKIFSEPQMVVPPPEPKKGITTTLTPDAKGLAAELGITEDRHNEMARAMAKVISDFTGKGKIPSSEIMRKFGEIAQNDNEFAYIMFAGFKTIDMVTMDPLSVAALLSSLLK